MSDITTTFFSFVNSSGLSETANDSKAVIVNISDDIVFPHLRQPSYMVAVLSMAYGLIFLFAVLGNMSVLCVVIRDRRFHSATYYLIANLALADFIMAVMCHPITLVTNLMNGKVCWDDDVYLHVQFWCMCFM